MKIFSKGSKFDLGDGNQFDSVVDLIEHYKKHPFSVCGGTTVRILKVIIHYFFIKQ